MAKMIVVLSIACFMCLGIVDNVTCTKNNKKQFDLVTGLQKVRSEWHDSVAKKLRLADFKQTGVELGRGGFGVVELVKGAGGKEFAMKALSVGQANSRAILNEVKILSKLRSPFVTKMFAFDWTKDKVFVVMGLAAGGSVEKLLRSLTAYNVAKYGQELGGHVCVKEQTARIFAAQLVLALIEIHDKRIVHGDLKPPNILIDGKGNLMVADFGLAKRLKSKQRDQKFTCTTAYCPPEIIAGKGHGKAADLWALGVLVFEILFGYTPFYDQPGMSKAEIAEKVKKGEFTIPTSHPTISDNARHFLQSLLRVDETHRLGYSHTSKLKRHKWFREFSQTKPSDERHHFRAIDWKKIEKRQVKMRYLPKVSNGKISSYIDTKHGIKIDKKT